MQGRLSKHIKTENQANLWNNFKSLALSYEYKTILFWFGAFKIEIINLDFFFWENRYFPCWQFYNGKKPYSKMFSCIKFFFVN